MKPNCNLLAAILTEEFSMASVGVMATVDWEGDTLNEGDLKAMKILNTQIFADEISQRIPIIHFIGPVRRSGFVRGERIRKEIKRHA